MKKQILQQYLAQTGVQLAIEDAFKELAKNRPSDPLVFVGQYLLKNSSKYETPLSEAEVDIQENMLDEAEKNNYALHAQEEILDYRRKIDQALTEEDEDEAQDKVEMKPLQKNLKERRQSSRLSAAKFDEEEETTITAKPNVFQNVQHIMNTTKFPDIQTHSKLSEKAHITTNDKAVVNSSLIFYKNKNLILSNILDDFKFHYQGHNDLLYSRVSLNQTINLQKEKMHKLVAQSDESLLEYLNEQSSFINAHSLTELARGGEAVVYKIEHQDLQEIVAKCTLIDEDFSDPNHRQESFKDILYETQSLKLLKNENYIAEVQEEIIEYDPEKNQIKNYCVIVERAQNTLNDLLKIWNDNSASQAQFEFFQPEKLAYYFYQILSIVEYLHQRNVYYGDMKPANVLVFRDQRVKVGDLGISISLDHDNNEDAKKYHLKGLTKAYTQVQMQIDFQNHKTFSKKELFEADRYAVLKTFERCIQSVSKYIKGPQERQIYYKIYQDLKDSSISETIEIWNECFANNIQLVNSLIEIMKIEHKYSAYQNIYQLTKYKNYIKHRLLHLYKAHYPSPLKRDSAADKTLPIDLLKVKRDNKIYLQVDSNFSKGHHKTSAAYERLMKDPQFKRIILDILETWMFQFNINSSDKDLTEFKEKIVEEFGVFYYFESPEKTFQAGKMISVNTDDEESVAEFLDEHSSSLAQYLQFQFLTCDDQDYWYQAFSTVNQFPGILPYAQTLTFMKFAQLLIRQQESEEVLNEEAYGKAIEYLLYTYNENEKSGKNTVRQQSAILISQCLIRLQDIQEAFNIIDKEYSKAGPNLDIQYIEVAIQRAQVLRIANNQEEALQICGAWLNQWISFLGESHHQILTLYGLIGELMLEMEQDQKTAFIYLKKYSNKSLETLARFKELIDEYSDLDDYEKYMEYIQKKQQLFLKR